MKNLEDFARFLPSYQDFANVRTSRAFTGEAYSDDGILVAAKGVMEAHSCRVPCNYCCKVPRFSPPSCLLNVLPRCNLVFCFLLPLSIIIVVISWAKYVLSHCHQFHGEF